MTGEEAKRRLEKQYKRQNDHIKTNYDRVAILLPKGAKDAIKATGESLNAYFNGLYAEDMKRRAAGTNQHPGAAPDLLEMYPGSFAGTSADVDPDDLPFK